MNVAGVLLLRFIGSLEHSAAAQAAYAVGYTELFSLITWTSVGLMGASATIAGQNLGAGNPERASHGVAVASRIGLGVAAVVGAAVPRRSRSTCSAIFGMTEPLVLVARPAAAALPERVGPLHHRGAELHRRPAGHRRHAQPALHLARLADRRAASGSARSFQATRRPRSRPTSGWRSCSATSRAPTLSVAALPPGQVAEHRGEDRPGLMPRPPPAPRPCCPSPIPPRRRPTPMMRDRLRRRGPALGLLLVLGVAGVLRLGGLDWDQRGSTCTPTSAS